MFWDRTVPPNKSKAQFMEWAIDQSRSVLVLWSAKSVGSNAVHGEAEDGLRRRALIATLMDDAVIPPSFQRIEPVKLTGWEGDRSDDQFQRLAARIAEVVPRTRPAASLPIAEAPAVERLVPAAAGEAGPGLPEPAQGGGRSPLLLVACVVAALLLAVLIWRFL